MGAPETLGTRYQAGMTTRDCLFAVHVTQQPISLLTSIQKRSKGRTIFEVAHSRLSGCRFKYATMPTSVGLLLLCLHAGACVVQYDSTS